MEHPDITLPLDCFVDEDITIDCSAMRLAVASCRAAVANSAALNGRRLRTGRCRRFCLILVCSLPHEQPSSNSRSVVKSPKSTPPCNGARLRSGTPQRTKLPKPTTRMSLQVSLRSASFIGFSFVYFYNLPNFCLLKKSTRSDAKLTPKKEAKSAVVPPYNYRKPEVSACSSTFDGGFSPRLFLSDSGVQVREIEKQTGKAVNPGQMLVTTV